MKIPEFSDRKKNATKVKMEKEGGKMDFETYKKELEFIRDQNDCERDLYHLVREILRSSDRMKDLSLRDVSGRHHSKMGEVFYGLSAFPDLVILDSEFKNKDNADWCIENADMIYGAVEVKALCSRLYDLDDFFDSVQNGKFSSEKKNQDDQWRLLGECIWNKKLIYTNGIQWQIIQCDYKNGEWENICKVVKERISRRTRKDDSLEEDWRNNINFQNISKKAKLFDMNAKKNKLENMKEDEWNQLIAFLNSIQWNPNQPEAQTK